MTRKIVIAGGGTAGWMAASYLRATLGEQVSVTVVESGAISTIGVGEATFSTIRHFFTTIGLEEHEWMPECHATYKLGIRFRNWRRPGHDFYHPFERPTTVAGHTLQEWWLRLRPSERFDRDCFALARLMDDKRSPHTLDGRLFDAEDTKKLPPGTRSSMAQEDTQYPYAYHFDASLLAAFLMRRATAGGVTRIVDTIQHVERDATGITGLVTGEHGTVTGDLYIDCTGFRGLLINQAMEEPLVSFQEFLPNDRAVALRVPTDVEKNGIAPYTTATAMENGWMWTIPLFERLGMGYVYAGDYCTPEEAERELREAAGPQARDLEANHIRMRIGRSRRSWVGNCVAIGLASGFVEPLESTGIFFIQHGIEQLVRHFPDGPVDPVRAEHYNAVVGRAIDGICEFLAFHYYSAQRTDNPYWKATKERPLPGDLQERVRLWQTDLPDENSIYPHYHGFEPYSWSTLLLGMGGVPAVQRPLVDMLDAGPAEREFARIRESARKAASALPSQYEYFASMRAGATG
ncbi:tryptophan halogenase family protein [Streptomyces sp. NPDC021020]|uniref:tryptophan halogenase family protein n=1 Tax=Streptomyces sp. NPDC021020 TaxID=3365109 RepID=UPI0037AFE866